VALSGGTAVALSGSNTVFTDDIANDTQPASGENPAGGLVAADLRANSVGSSEAANESLTGADIKNRSGVDTCQAPLTAKFGPICAGSDGGLRTYQGALSYCAARGLRLPSHSEAVTLAVNYNVPGLPPAGGTFDFFWTDAASAYQQPSTFEFKSNSVVVDEDGGWYHSRQDDTLRTVCVTDPSA
jgi:hypothetical protein